MGMGMGARARADLTWRMVVGVLEGKEGKEGVIGVPCCVHGKHGNMASLAGGLACAALHAKSRLNELLLVRPMYSI